MDVCDTFFCSKRSHCFLFLLVLAVVTVFCKLKQMSEAIRFDRNTGGQTCQI